MGYNGYKNYQTWAWCLWLDNEEGSQRWALQKARDALEDAPLDSNVPKIWTEEEAARFRLADRFREDAEHALPDLGGTVWGDLLTSALGEVDWDEVARHYLDAVKEGVS